MSLLLNILIFVECFYFHSRVVVLKSESEFSPELWDEDVSSDKTEEVFVEDIPKKDDNGPLINKLKPK